MTLVRPPAARSSSSFATAVVAACAALIALAPAASAHSPTDFLKVPVGKQATVLLPPITRLPGRLEVTVGAPASFVLAAVSAGPGWQSRVAPHMAVLDGRGAAGNSMLVTVTGTAQRPGRLPLIVQVSSPVAPTQTYQWSLIALAGYAQPAAGTVDPSRPDAPVATGARHMVRLWPVSVLLAAAALALLVGRPRRQRRAVPG